MVTIADWIIVAATLVTAGATLVLAIITRRTLDESKATRELAARVALMPERLRVLRQVEELTKSAIARPGIESSVRDGLFDLEQQVEYLFGSESVMAFSDLIFAIGKLNESTEGHPNKIGQIIFERSDGRDVEDDVHAAHDTFQRRARNLMTILPYRGTGQQGTTRHGWPDAS